MEKGLLVGNEPLREEFLPLLKELGRDELVQILYQREMKRHEQAFLEKNKKL